ncbi:MAG: hypothetical protein BRD36_03070 [Bacteroidetes bacterium QH_7_64_110]|nr:MAG: hypothetical protein BRD36_03070 [Bacteroidetes bacterium QH_7_64_110]
MSGPLIFQTIYALIAIFGASLTVVRLQSGDWVAARSSPPRPDRAAEHGSGMTESACLVYRSPLQCLLPAQDFTCPQDCG